MRGKGRNGGKFWEGVETTKHVEGKWSVWLVTRLMGYRFFSSTKLGRFCGYENFVGLKLNQFMGFMHGRAFFKMV